MECGKFAGAAMKKLTKAEFVQNWIAENGSLPPNVEAVECDVDCGINHCEGWKLEIKERKGEEIRISRK